MVAVSPRASGKIQLRNVNIATRRFVVAFMSQIAHRRDC
jgi:hypothetical protein